MAGYIDPDLLPMVGAIPPTDISDPVAARERLLALQASRPPFEVPTDLTAQWLQVDGVPVLSFRPVDWGSGPALVYLHGGGFVMGSAAGDQLIASQLAQATHGLVLSVDYRLAPEHPFPAAHDDAYAVLRWAAGQPGVERVALAGSSAGAGIAAGVALRARDEGVPVAALLLEIPALDDRAATASAQWHDAVLWHRGNILDSWRFYLGGAPATPYASPPRAESLAGLPPTYVGVCSTDALRDEGIAFAQRLSDDGVATELVMYPGLFHGAASTFPTVPACQRARAALLSAAERLVARR